MSFNALKHRVERSEQILAGRILQSSAAWRGLGTRWREAWTPPRIVLAGLLAGFFSGKANPQAALRRAGKLASPRTIQLITSLSGLLASAQSAYAAVASKRTDADDDAQAAQQNAETTAERSDAQAPTTATPAAAHSEHRRTDPTWERQPAPAEAATDVSER